MEEDRVPKSSGGSQAPSVAEARLDPVTMKFIAMASVAFGNVQVLVDVFIVILS